jgi:acetolactate synthase-1/3 small subunit
MRHLIAILLQNEAGALTRVTGLISSRGYNIESLSVAPTNDPTVSRVTLVTIGSDQVIAQINAQLLKLVDVVAVEDMTGGDALARELLLIKVQILPKHVEAVDALLRRVGGKVLSPNPSSYIVELTSTETEIGDFIANVAAFGEIIEVVRSGVLGIARANPRLHVVK